MSQLRLVNEVHETRLKELEQSKNMAMENRVAAVVKDMNSRVSALEKEMSIMMTPKQVRACVHPNRNSKEEFGIRMGGGHAGRRFAHGRGVKEKLNCSEQVCSRGFGVEPVGCSTISLRYSYGPEVEVFL